MIFENDEVTRLVIEWQNTHDPTIMCAILDKSNSLIEVMASKHDQLYRDDLIQESRLKLQYACDFFEADISTLHNFFTTVIHNICTTFVVKQEREYLIDDRANEDYTDSGYSELPDISVKSDDSDLLSELTLYMRRRFISLPSSILDDCAEIIYNGLCNGDTSRSILAEITAITLSRSMATIVYNVAIIYMRWKNISCAAVSIDNINEFTLLNELKLMVGEVHYSRLLVAFAGMTIRFPQ